MLATGSRGVDVNDPVDAGDDDASTSDCNGRRRLPNLLTPPVGPSTCGAAAKCSAGKGLALAVVVAPACSMARHVRCR